MSTSEYIMPVLRCVRGVTFYPLNKIYKIMQMKLDTASGDYQYGSEAFSRQLFMVALCNRADHNIFIL